MMSPHGLTSSVVDATLSVASSAVDGVFVTAALSVAMAASKADDAVVKFPSTVDETVAKGASTVDETVAMATSKADDTVVRLPSTADEAVAKGASTADETVAMAASMASDTIVRCPSTADETDLVHGLVYGGLDRGLDLVRGREFRLLWSAAVAADLVRAGAGSAEAAAAGRGASPSARIGPIQRWPAAGPRSARGRRRWVFVDAPLEQRPRCSSTDESSPLRPCLSFAAPSSSQSSSSSVSWDTPASVDYRPFPVVIGGKFEGSKSGRAVSFDLRRDARTAVADSPWTVDEMRGGHLAPEHLDRIQDEGYETRQKVLDLLEPFVDRRAELSPRLRRELEHDDEAHVPVRTWLVARFPNMEEALAFAVKCRRELRARAEERRAVRRAARCARELSSDLDGEHWRAPLPSSRSRRQPVRFSAAA